MSETERILKFEIFRYNPQKGGDKPRMETFEVTEAPGMTIFIALNDIIYGRDIPTDFEINGALMAQNGKILRHGFFSWCGNTPNAVRNSLTIYGSLLSNQKSYWNFGSSPTSGFVTRTILHDGNLQFGPPPYFPTEGEYEQISWEE